MERRLRKALLVGVPVLLVAAVGLAVGLGGDDGGHTAANRAQVKHACEGLLPYGDLRERIPDDAAGRLNEYGTALHPGQQTRSLLFCEVEWPGHGSFGVRAVAPLGAMPMHLDTETLTDPEPIHDAYEAPGITGQWTNGTAWVAADCPKGITGRPRTAPGLYVTVDQDMGDDADDDKAMGRLAQFRAAVRVANFLTGRAHCDVPPLKRPTQVVDIAHENYTVAPGCRGTAREAGPHTDWSGTPGPTPSWLMSLCDGDDGDREVSASSWAGPLAEPAYQQYADVNGAPGEYTGDKAKSIERNGTALWARSECAAGPAYHRVKGDPATLTAFMDRYLSDPEAWPKQQHCHDTEIIGRAELPTETGDDESEGAA